MTQILEMNGDVEHLWLWSSLQWPGCLRPTAISPHFPGCFTISYPKKKAQMPHKYIKHQVLEWEKNLNKAVFNLNRVDFLRK